MLLLYVYFLNFEYDNIYFFKLCVNDKIKMMLKLCW